MYDNMINKFIWGGIENENVYLDENITRMLSNIRYNFGNLATALISEGKSDSARTVLDRCQELMPNNRIPYDVFMIGMIDSYYMIKEVNKAEKLAKDILTNTCQDLEFLISLKNPYSGYLQYEKQLSMHVLRELIKITKENGNKKFSAEIEQNYETYGMALSRNM
jgi:ATP/maltotriose-dependent transcriptional regulator MalT